MYEEKEKNKDIIKSITAVLLNYTCPNVKSKKVKEKLKVEDINTYIRES